MINKTKIETSKKIILFIAICFAVALLYCIGIFTYSVVHDKYCDFTLPITFITTTGAALGCATAFYYNKARHENINKIKRSFLQEKYTILKEIGALNEYRVREEIETSINEVDGHLSNIESTLEQEDIAYNNYG